MVHFIIAWNVCVLFVRKFPASITHSWSAALLFMGIVGLSVFVASLTHRWIEQPSIAYGKRWAKQRFSPSTGKGMELMGKRTEPP